MSPCLNSGPTHYSSHSVSGHVSTEPSTGAQSTHLSWARALVPVVTTLSWAELACSGRLSEFLLIVWELSYCIILSVTHQTLDTSDTGQWYSSVTLWHSSWPLFMIISVNSSPFNGFLNLTVWFIIPFREFSFSPHSVQVNWLYWREHLKWQTLISIFNWQFCAIISTFHRHVLDWIWICLFPENYLLIELTKQHSGLILE